MEEVKKFFTNVDEKKTLAGAYRKGEAEPAGKERIDEPTLYKLIGLINNSLSPEITDPAEEKANYDLIENLSNGQIIDLINNFKQLAVTNDTLFYSAIVKSAEVRGLYRQQI